MEIIPSKHSTITLLEQFSYNQSMVFCPLCGKEVRKKNGRIFVEKMTKQGLKKQVYQKYLCINNHRFTSNFSSSEFSNSFIEYAVIVYLRSLSLNTTIDILRIYFEINVLTKETLLLMIAKVADLLPSSDEIDALYHLRRSGYLAFDGVWYK